VNVRVKGGRDQAEARRFVAEVVGGAELEGER